MQIKYFLTQVFFQLNVSLHGRLFNGAYSGSIICQTSSPRLLLVSVARS